MITDELHRERKQFNTPTQKDNKLYPIGPGSLPTAMPCFRFGSCEARQVNKPTSQCLALGTDAERTDPP